MDLRPCLCTRAQRSRGTHEALGDRVGGRSAAQRTVEYSDLLLQGIQGDQHWFDNRQQDGIVLDCRANDPDVAPLTSDLEDQAKVFSSPRTVFLIFKAVLTSCARALIIARIA